jgi:3',5'-cyclic AMP phosphodiesterase CpdA
LTFALAHLSDPHLAGWSVERPSALANKRVTGWLSWRVNRRRIHLARVLDLMLADMADQPIDHIAVTGDLVNISLPQEFENATRWLNQIGPAEKVTVIPGNHDAYVRVPQSDGWSHWRDYMTDLAWERGDTVPVVADSFPFVRRIGPLALIGLSSAVPTPPFFASGTLGPAQLRALHEILVQLGRIGAFRVVLIHHPPLYGEHQRRKALTDAREFGEIVLAAGAELILHGHMHMATLGHIGETPVIGVPSASALPWHHKDAAAYNLYRIARAEDDWRLAVEIRGLTADRGRFAPAGGFELTIPVLRH